MSFSFSSFIFEPSSRGSASLGSGAGPGICSLYPGHTITERWLSISQRLSNANRFTTSDAIYCLLSPLHAEFVCHPGVQGGLGHAVPTTRAKSHVKLLYCVLETVFLGVTHHCWLLEAFGVLFHKDPWAFSRPVWYERLMYGWELCSLWGNRSAFIDIRYKGILLWWKLRDVLVCGYTGKNVGGQFITLSI